ncbi:MAG: DUF389 domain-containing protein [Bacteroidota bacterium]
MTRRKKVTVPDFANDFRAYLRYLFNLEEDQASERATIEEIRKGIPFRGTNLWILMFAIMVCSIGLNVNSPAVVIGAMLISPLMGPIMGVGMGVGINSFEMIKQALTNLGVAVFISVLVSALYFLISPPLEDQSELLARTQPTLWDVMIAFFGGLAGIVAGSRREKSNAIPGVAIATALMPPLCTAGFGLATWQLNYFIGAFYLFFINSVFISLSTFLIVRFLDFPRKDHDDPLREKRVRTYIAIFVLLTIIPSVYTAVTVVRKTVFERNAASFVRQELQFEESQILSRKFTYRDPENKIEIRLLGKKIDEEIIELCRRKLHMYNLQGTELVIRQGFNVEENKGIDLADVRKLNEQLRAEFIDNLYQRNEELLKTKDDQIALLEAELLRYKAREVPVKDILDEVKAINENVRELSVSPTIISNLDSLSQDTLYLAYANFRKRPKKSELRQLEGWLKARTKADSLILITD